MHKNANQVILKIKITKEDKLKNYVFTLHTITKPLLNFKIHTRKTDAF